MSLFVTGLAFADPTAVADAKIGILAASIVAAAVGMGILHVVLPKKGEISGAADRSAAAGGH